MRAVRLRRGKLHGGGAEVTVILSQQGSDGHRRTCSGTCHAAKKDKCACICGGRFHGVARGRGTHRPENVEEAEKMRTIKLASQAQLVAAA